MNDQTDPAEPTSPADPTPPPLDADQPPADLPTVEPTKPDSKTMAMLCHLLGIITSFVGPLIIWLIKKDEDAFIDDQGKEALNFQITILIAYAVGFATWFICIGALIFTAAWVFNLIFCIMGTVKANEGVAYRYSVAIRLIK